MYLLLAEWNISHSKQQDQLMIMFKNLPLDQLNPELSSLSGDALYWAQKSLERAVSCVV